MTNNQPSIIITTTNQRRTNKRAAAKSNYKHEFGYLSAKMTPPPIKRDIPSVSRLHYVYECCHFLFAAKWKSWWLRHFKMSSCSPWNCICRTRWNGMECRRHEQQCSLVWLKIHCALCAHFIAHEATIMPPKMTTYSHNVTAMSHSLAIHEWAFIGSSRAIEKREHQINQTKTIIIYQNTYKHKNHARNSPLVLHMPSHTHTLEATGGAYGPCRRHYTATEHGKCLFIGKECATKK